MSENPRTALIVALVVIGALAIFLLRRHFVASGKDGSRDDVDESSSRMEKQFGRRRASISGRVGRFMNGQWTPASGALVRIIDIDKVKGPIQGWSPIGLGVFDNYIDFLRSGEDGNVEGECWVGKGRILCTAWIAKDDLVLVCQSLDVPHDGIDLGEIQPRESGSMNVEIESRFRQGSGRVPSLVFAGHGRDGDLFVSAIEIKTGGKLRVLGLPLSDTEIALMNAEPSRNQILEQWLGKHDTTIHMNVFQYEHEVTRDGHSR